MPTVPTSPLKASATPQGDGAQELRLTEQEWRQKTQNIDDAYVSDVSVQFLYKPHSITAMVILIGFLAYMALFAPEGITQLSNFRRAAVGVSVIVLILGMLIFPSGPFIRPHPVLWRVAFGIGFLYQIWLLAILFSTKSDARSAMLLFDDSLGKPLTQRSYAVDCDITWPNVKNAVFDIFFVSHFLGWFAKALLVRDTMLCWTMSILWEFIEIIFTFMLPNFAECWWDQWILDVILTNGTGIFLGIKFVRWMEIREYQWSSYRDLPGVWSKAKRALMQFTPLRFDQVRWEKTKTIIHFFSVQIVIIFLSVQDLNSFFLKQILWVPPENALNVYRLGIWFFVGVPCVRQLYVYITDPNCKRMGSFLILGLTMLITELMIVVKFGQGEFPEPMPEPIKKGLYVAGAAYVVFSFVMMFRIRARNNKTKNA